ncbi:glycosyltransferase, partial [Escherichia coli]|nr:glycosyltransferase [Escherichia coli]
MISVLTPTYNRAYTLKRLYESLICQTTKSFQWVVVNDGSNDETESII